MKFEYKLFKKTGDIWFKTFFALYKYSVGSFLLIKHIDNLYSRKFLKSRDFWQFLQFK